MRELTQTHVHPGGNCVQFAVASLLDIDAGLLPPQHELEKAGKRYYSCLNVWLMRHRGEMYVEVPASLFPALRVADPGWHLISGATVRTPATGVYHQVVGRYGEVAWDPHPTGAGLTLARSWGFIVLAPPENVSYWAGREEMGDSDALCRCPPCEAGRG